MPYFISGKGVTLSSLFIANDTEGNVRNVSLQCQSSDLSVDSVVLAFYNLGEFHEGGICYKSSLSTNMEYVAKHCERRGCSNVQVSGERGCGHDTHLHNYGAYIYYNCNRSRQNQCQSQITVISTTVQPSM